MGLKPYATEIGRGDATGPPTSFFYSRMGLKHYATEIDRGYAIGCNTFSKSHRDDRFICVGIYSNAMFKKEF